MLTKYNEYLSKIDEYTKNNIVELESVYKMRERFHDEYLKADTETERKRVHELHKLRENKYRENETNNKFHNLVIRVMRHNANIILLNEISPVVIDVVNKYKNKPYGEKTRAKIKNELKELTNCAVILEETCIRILPLNKDGYSINYDYLYIYVRGGALTGDNKIVELKQENFNIHGNLIDDCEKYVCKLISDYDEIHKKRNELSALIDAFNPEHVDGIKEIDYKNSFYDSYLDFYY